MGLGIEANARQMQTDLGSKNVFFSSLSLSRSLHSTQFVCDKLRFKYCKRLQKLYIILQVGLGFYNVNISRVCGSKKGKKIKFSKK